MRKYYIDNIRWMTIVLVVVYHIIFMFNSIETSIVIGPITQFHGQDVIQYLLYPWFMVILFLISGMCARYYLEKHTDREFIKARTRKLLVPSTMGVFVMGWMQGYISM
ncbi:MAG: acyltransferase, partial [Lachnospiraceae bacterium]|nr:acyltransferase [Lachnospiraceae bacterium]